MHAGDATAVVFLSATVAVGIVDGAFVRSTDGGVTWTVGAPVDGRSHLVAVSADVVLAWGRAGAFPDYDDRIFRSSDAGQTWTDLGEVIDPGAFASSMAFAVPDPQTVVASDGAGNMYHSPDAGQTWAPAFASPGFQPGFLSSAEPAFADPLTGYFGFGAGFVIKTIDGGASWTQISSGSGRVPQRHGSFCRRHPHRRRRQRHRSDQHRNDSVDPERVVHGRPPPGGPGHRSPGGRGRRRDLPCIQQRRRRCHLVGRGDDTPGSRGGGPLLHHLSRRLGHRLRFQRCAPSSTRPTAATRGRPSPVSPAPTWPSTSSAANGWAANVSGRFYRTTDGGATWIQGDLPGSPLQIQDMDFFDENIGYAVGWWGDAFRSDDAGATWQTLPTPNGDDQLTDIYLLGPDELWVSTNDDVAYYSATGGQNWAVLDIGSAGFGNFAAIAATPAGDAWVAGSQGDIEHFTGPPPPPLNQPPVASFDFLTTGLSVAFTDTSTDPDGTIVSWLWDFGDGTTSSEQDPSHVFPGADTFHVRLTVTDDDGAIDDALRFVVVQPGPGGTFGDFTEVTPLDPLFVTPQDEDFWVATTAPADFDGDGDLDIAVLGFYVVYNTSVEERLVLLRNDGPAAPDEWEFAYIDVPLGTLSAGASDLAWGDVDGDGDQDLAVGTDGQTVIYRNDAGTLMASDTVLPAYWEDNFQADFDLRSITWADYDNDGDLDLLLPSVWDDTTFEYRTALMRNDGANGTGGWIFTEVAAGLAPTGHAQSAWADFDGDQDLDLLLIHLAPLTDDGFIRRYRNDGGGVFVGEDILGALTIEHGEGQWGDYDDDGDLDILVAGHIKELDGTYNTVLRIYRNDAETYVPIEVIACPSCDGWFDLTAATWADYDSDGDVDILLAGSFNSGSQIDGRAKIYNNDNGVFSDSGNQLPAPRASGSRGGSFTWLDIDGEGDLDYFIAGEYFVPGGNGLVEAQMHVYRNDAPGQNEAPTAPSFLNSQVDETNGSVLLWWNPATDDLTPTDSLTYDLRLYRDGAPASAPSVLPEPGSVSSVGEWTLTGLPDGSYTWTLRAVDSAYNGGPPAEGAFVVDTPGAAVIFTDGFETGDTSGWSSILP